MLLCSRTNAVESNSPTYQYVCKVNENKSNVPFFSALFLLLLIIFSLSFAF